MTEGQWGLLIGGAWMFLIMPMSLNQAGQKRRQIQRGNFKDAMLRRAPDTSFKPRLIAIGIALSAAWVTIILFVFLG